MPGFLFSKRSIVFLLKIYIFNYNQKLHSFFLNRFTKNQLPNLDGRCVQGQRTYSPWRCWSTITSDSIFTKANCSLRSVFRRTLNKDFKLPSYHIFVFFIVAHVWPIPLGPWRLDIILTLLPFLLRWGTLYIKKTLKMASF